MKDKFFKFLKDYRAYELWIAIVKVERPEGLDLFMEYTAPYTWIGGAFTWSSHSTIDWSDLDMKWHVICTA